MVTSRWGRWRGRDVDDEQSDKDEDEDQIQRGATNPAWEGHFLNEGILLGGLWKNYITISPIDLTHPGCPGYETVSRCPWFHLMIEIKESSIVLVTIGAIFDIFSTKSSSAESTNDFSNQLTHASMWTQPLLFALWDSLCGIRVIYCNDIDTGTITTHSHTVTICFVNWAQKYRHRNSETPTGTSHVKHIWSHKYDSSGFHAGFQMKMCI